MLQKFNKLYAYFLVFAILFIEFSYCVVVENFISGTTRSLILFLLSIILILNFKKIKIKSLFFLLYIVIFILLSVIIFGDLNNYILFLLPIIIGFLLSITYEFKFLCKVFFDIILFFAIFSLGTYIITIFFPGFIKNLPFVGYVYESQAEIHNAFFSVCVYNSTYIRNYGFTWEPGAFSILLIIALFLSFTILNDKKYFKKIILIIAILTTFSTMGYIAMILVLFVMLFKKININRKMKFFIICIFLLSCLIILILPQNLKVLVFGKLNGLFSSSNNSNVAETTQDRINAVYYPLKAFFTSPFFGVGYSNFSIINKYYCNNVATNTIANWLALSGLSLGLPFIYYYFKFIYIVSKKYVSKNILVFVILVMSAILMISTESLLRISLIYVIIFYGVNSLKVCEKD